MLFCARVGMGLLISLALQMGSPFSQLTRI